MKYIIDVIETEVWDRQYIVEANSIDEAYKKFEDGIWEDSEGDNIDSKTDVKAIYKDEVLE
jgi:hypothetical protein